MKKIIYLLSFIFCVSFAYSQQDTVKLSYDTLIINKAYKSYYSKKYEAPVAIVYTLYKGGGECSRKGMNFTNDIKGLPTATNKDYAMSGYDKGHMANAEDFAYDCNLEELTFRYYNCVPQNPELNRGPWKHYETLIRKLSQNDTLQVLCYNEFDGKKNGNASIPNKCYKFVFDKKTKQIMFAFYYTNNSSPNYTDLLDRLGKFYFILKLIEQ